jgi:hypothetical protein
MSRFTGYSSLLNIGMVFASISVSDQLSGDYDDQEAPISFQSDYSRTHSFINIALFRV